MLNTTSFPPIIMAFVTFRNVFAKLLVWYNDNDVT